MAQTTAAAETTHLLRRRLPRDGEELYYELAHRGEDTRPVVVLTHGAGGSHAVWFHQVPTLAEHFRVLTWDSRGFGNSSCRSGEVRVQDAVADLAAILADCGAGDAPLHLVGQSMGGWWVVAFALAHPGRVASLTLSDTPGGVWTEALRDHFTAGTRGRPLQTDEVGVHRALGATTMRERPAQAFLYQQLGSFFEPPMKAVLRTLADAQVDPAAVRALGVPLLVIAGEEDEIFPASMLRDLAERLGARYGEVPAAGHSPYFESPAAYDAVLLPFLRSAGHGH